MRVLVKNVCVNLYELCVCALVYAVFVSGWAGECELTSPSTVQPAAAFCAFTKLSKAAPSMNIDSPRRFFGNFWYVLHNTCTM